MMSISARIKPLMDTLNRFSAWLLLLAIIWLCWVAARILWLVLAPPVAPALPLQAIQNNTNLSADNRNTFAIFAESEAATVAPQPPPNVLLKGVLIAIPESLSSAMLDVNGEVKNYRIGDSLQETGFTLIAVDWNAVIIADAADQQTVISLPELLPLDQRGLDTNAIANQRLPNNNPLSATNNGLALPESAAMTNDNNEVGASQPADTGSAIDEAVTALKENPASYLSRMGVMASGEGYQVTAAMPTALRNRLGLEAGDKVLTVNGQTVGNSPAQDANVLQQAQQSGEAQIEVQRGDQVITIRQQF
ncbi:general secretion pathway protein [Psychrobacter sp. AH5]|uniref:type II secretion system protein N n=1 Tax=Psychrobacter sp. AH5 TaxID=2937433 RepID=UPI00333FB6C8